MTLFINLNDVQKNTQEQKRKEILEQHPYEIWMGKNGRWYTHIHDKTKKDVGITVGEFQNMLEMHANAEVKK